MLGCRVEQEFVECSDIQRHRQHLETEHCGMRADEALRDHGNEIGLGHDMQRLEVVRNRERYVSSVTLFAKPAVHGIFGEFPSNDRNMLHLEKGGRTRNLARNRVAVSHRTGIAIGKELLLIKALEHIRNAGDGEIDRVKLE
jgi:hypothetical protein